MGGDPESPSRKQLGKIMLQQKLVSPAQLQEAERRRRGRSKLERALQALSKEHGVPGVDLTAKVVPLSTLRLIPVEIAREHVVFPFATDGEGVRVAMAKPSDAAAVEEVEFVTGRKLQLHVAVESVLRGVIEQAYERLARGDEYYVGANVSEAQLAELGLPGLEPAPFPVVESQEPAKIVEAKAAPIVEPPALTAADALPAVPPPRLERQLEGAPVMAVTPLAGATPLPHAPSLDPAFGERIRPSRPPPMPNHEAGAKVLVAMPAGPCRDAVATALAPAGLTLIDAFDGAEALDRAITEAPRAIVLEAGLDGVHGFEVCRRLQANPDFTGKPVIVVSQQLGGWRLEQDAREALGIRYFFGAPVDVERLAKTVRLAMEGAALPEEPPPLSEAAEQKWNEAMDAFDANDLDRAIAALEQASKIDGEAFELQYHLGLLYGRRDDLFFAIAALERAVTVQPHHFSALKNLAVVYQRAGFHRKAVDSWQRALGEAPDEETRDSIKEHMMSLL